MAKTAVASRANAVIVCVKLRVAVVLVPRDSVVGPGGGEQIHVAILVDVRAKRSVAPGWH
jgi:hypothetical protein